MAVFVRHFSMWEREVSHSGHKTTKYNHLKLTHAIYVYAQFMLGLATCAFYYRIRNTWWHRILYKLNSPSPSIKDIVDCLAWCRARILFKTISILTIRLAVARCPLNCSGLINLLLSIHKCGISLEFYGRRLF